MVVGKLDVMRFAVEPAKAKSPLIVDANAMLAFAVAGQFLEAIGWRNSHVFQRFGGVKQRQLTKCGALQFSSESFDPLTPEESFRVLVRESPYHGAIIAPGVNNVKRYATHKSTRRTTKPTYHDCCKSFMSRETVMRCRSGAATRSRTTPADPLDSRNSALTTGSAALG
jgi:hypothetical protein